MPLKLHSREKVFHRMHRGLVSSMREGMPALIALAIILASTIVLQADAQTAPAQKSGHPIDGLEQFIPPQMQKWKVPGLAIAVVQNGQVIYSHGFGLRDVKANLPVTSKTIFAIGSISKSFNSLSMGILNDEGKLDWDKPVRQYLPEFQMHDPVASERMTLRDLISHRVGMAGHDLRSFARSEERQRAAMHALPPFAVLVLEGYGRRSLAGPPWDLLLAAAAPREARSGFPAGSATGRGPADRRGARACRADARPRS